MKRVIWIDPGEKVGWARALVDDKGNWSELRHGITPWREFVLALHARQVYEVVPRHDDYEPYDLIGYERYTLYRTHALQQIGSDMQTSQCIGAIRLIGWLSGARIVSQAAKVQGPRGPARSSAPQWLKDYLAKFPERHDEAHDESALLHLWQWTFARHDVDPATHQGGMDA